MAESIITVKRRTGFTVLPNSTLRDRRLSLKTRAILAIMVSMPDDWDYTVSGLASVCGTGRDAVRSALRELEDGGYLTRVQLHDDAGHFSRNEYIVTDEPTGEGDTPLSENPLTGKSLTDEPLTGNPTQQNKDCTNTPYSPPEGGRSRACAKVFEARTGLGYVRTVLEGVSQEAEQRTSPPGWAKAQPGYRALPGHVRRAGSGQTV